MRCRADTMASRKAKIQPLDKLANDVTVWLNTPPQRRGGDEFVTLTTVTSGYYRTFVYKKVAER